ncbi:DUF6999 family protein [Steroidobacter gossypii]|uniref:DUF6999 family protein n=1 Tax=Steroidobacter gossypii TaxID=2805490 RepID=UPI00389B24B3
MRSQIPAPLAPATCERAGVCSLQIDETIGWYVARLLGAAWTPGLINYRHPLVPLSTMRAGFRRVLHDLAPEMRHALPVQYKRAQKRQRETNRKAAIMSRISEETYEQTQHWLPHARHHRHIDARRLFARGGAAQH